MNSISGWKSRRAQVGNAAFPDTMSARAYNLLMGAVVFYGLLLNYIICIAAQELILYMNPLVFIIGYFVCCFAGTMLAHRSTSPVISFLGYNLVVVPVGLVVSSCVYIYGGVNSAVVSQAFLYTLMITVVMVLAAAVYPGFFAKLGGILFSCLLALVIVGALSMFFGGLNMIYSFAAAAIFSLYIGYDFFRAQQFPYTADNAVDCALDIYLDIINLFVQLLRILSAFTRRD